MIVKHRKKDKLIKLKYYHKKKFTVHFAHLPNRKFRGQDSKGQVCKKAS